MAAPPPAVAVTSGLAQPAPVSAAVPRPQVPLVQITTATGAAYVAPPPRPARTVAQLEAEQAQLAAKGLPPWHVQAHMLRSRACFLPWHSTSNGLQPDILPCGHASISIVSTVEAKLSLAHCPWHHGSVLAALCDKASLVFPRWNSHSVPAVNQRASSCRCSDGMLEAQSSASRTSSASRRRQRGHLARRGNQSRDQLLEGQRKRRQLRRVTLLSPIAYLIAVTAVVGKLQQPWNQHPKTCHPMNLKLYPVAGDDAAALGEDEQLLHAAAEELLLPQASSESEQELERQVCTRRDNWSLH